MSDEKIFPEGFIFKKAHPNAPDFIKGKVSIKMKDFIEWARNHHKDGWVNLDLAESREGKYYASLDTFVPDASRASEPAAPQADQGKPFDDDLDIPF